jgi:hypothetical protein
MLGRQFLKSQLTARESAHGERVTLDTLRHLNGEKS